MYNRLVQFLLICLFRLVHVLRRRPVRPRPEPAAVRSVLIASTTGLGDTIIATPCFAAARKRWPDARITALLHRRWASMFTESPDIDNIIVYPGKFKGVWGVIRKLRKSRPDIGLVVHGNDPDIVPLIYLSGAGYIVGRKASRFSFLMDSQVDLKGSEKPYIEQFLDIVRAAAGPVSGDGERLYLPSAMKAWAMDYWRQKNLKTDEKLIALNPGGSRPPKRWPDRHWRELLEALMPAPGVRVALFGSPAEEKVMKALADGLEGPEPFIVARPDMMEVIALLSRANALIGPDSGLVHAAVALDVPVIVLFGPDNPALSAPYLNRAPAAVLQADAGACPDMARCRVKTCPDNVCLGRIEPGQVLAFLAKISV